MSQAARGSGQKLSRQQLRAQQREKLDAAGWIARLRVTDPWLADTIRRVMAKRSFTRAELEEAIGMSLEGMNVPDNAGTSEPDRIEIQHVLISFAGSGTSAKRSKEEAAALGADVLARAQAGEDFDALVRELTDDSHPGIYRLANNGVSPASGNEYPRGRMVAAFGDVGFALGVGDVGIANFDQRTSPYGWHIIKRLQ